jgi:hypothetical protein
LATSGDYNLAVDKHGLRPWLASRRSKTPSDCAENIASPMSPNDDGVGPRRIRRRRPRVGLTCMPPEPSIADMIIWAGPRADREISDS